LYKGKNRTGGIEQAEQKKKKISDCGGGSLKGSEKENFKGETCCRSETR